MKAIGVTVVLSCRRAASILVMVSTGAGCRDGFVI
jgi:hypothetical protein